MSEETMPQARCSATDLPVWNVVSNGRYFLRCHHERPFGGSVFEIRSRDRGVCQLCTAVERVHNQRMSRR